ncbi:MAG: DMT(drug/metabolite transporter) superfamily permease [Bacteroidetes bacterium]|nr:MAG: DMT(drug/metabolite transporter) superfamily permease [Bacteroidota bacterium]
MTTPKSNITVLHWVIFIALAVTWGSSFILMKRGMDVFSSDQVAALRIFIAFLFILPFTFRHVKKEFAAHWKGYLGMGVCGNLIPAFLFTAAETGISSSLTGILNSLTPIFTLVTGLLIFGNRAGWLQALGLLIGLGGAVGLVLSGEDDGKNTHLWYAGLVVIATLFYGLSVNIIKSKLGGINSVTATVWALLFIGPPAGIYLFTTDFVSRMSLGQAWASLGYTTILAVFGTALSVMVYNLLIKQAGTLFAASVTYAIPIVALGWGVIDDEPVSVWHLVFIGVILAGVWLVTKKK